MKLRATITTLLAALCVISAGCTDSKANTDYMDPIRHPTAKAKAPWIKLSDYPRPSAPDTGWGIHDHTNGDWIPKDPDAFFKELKGKYGFSWFKILALGENKLGMVEAAKKNGVEPVVRLYRPGHLPYYPKDAAEEEELHSLIRKYVKAGAHYFEYANEPNIGGEWSGEWNDLHKSHQETIAVMCENWLQVKKIIQAEGGIPVFHAMTPGSAGEWYRDSFEYFKSKGKIEGAFAGAAIGIHPYPLNHPLDYPFNEKKNMPHATKQQRYDSLMKDNTCFNIMELVLLLEDKYLPYQIPILATESGASIGSSEDRSYPAVTLDKFNRVNMEIFNRMNPEANGYWGDAFFSEMVWAYGGTGSFTFSGWFNNSTYGNMQILKMMEKTAKFDRGIAFKKK